MRLTVDATLLPGLSERWRLQRDASWRLLSQDLRADAERDWLTSNPAETQGHCGFDISVSLGPKTYLANPRLLGTDNVTAWIRPVVHRETRPRRFTVDELRQVICRGDDSHSNVLIIDLNGHFSLWRWDEEAHTGPFVAVRRQTFMAGRVCVGPLAAADDQFIDATYAAMVQGWVAHLRTGEVQRHVHLPARRPVEALWQEAEALTSHLR